jgi:hypothetical protein
MKKKKQFTSLQPRDGDSVGLCSHLNASQYHFFKIKGEIVFSSPDGRTVIPVWVIVCDYCFKTYKNPLTCIEGDAIWDGDDPIVEVDNDLRT